MTFDSMLILMRICLMFQDILGYLKEFYLFFYIFLFSTSVLFPLID